MEGLSYWIFLAIFYLLSAFMKKRRQQGSETSTEKKPNIFQNQFFKDLFQDLKEVDVESKDSFLEEFDDSYEEEISVEEQDKNLEEELIFSEKLSKLPDLEVQTKIKAFSNRDIKRQMKINFLKGSESLKSGIMIKEILDKPRALRKKRF
ncbi:MAG: hypothetical protein ACKVKJ_03810 [Fidelibacterota bacterium]|jgi:hypothetical protein|nr:hypothetical protein [Candidatus Neomarinimicrobiota bacterium]|tara:strand:- start:4986 stop:5435 length:450 start_codon:yes stop_codon:yes gene_type:complete